MLKVNKQQTLMDFDDKQTFYSNGKLLITGEYLVLNGALALALPTKFGQYLHVSSIKEPVIIWKSYDADGSCWFETNLTFNDIVAKRTFEEDAIKNTLVEILHYAYKQNPSFLKSTGFEIKTELTFPRNWGLGTSSTLINNIAQWLQIDAFTLLRESFGGSGYDIACAQNNMSLLYQLVEEKPSVKPIVFHPDFAENIFFVYLNRKQNSRHAIQNFINKQTFLEQETKAVSTISEELTQHISFERFCYLLEKHEILLSTILELSTVKERLFADFNGVIKSLGAWGGDFILVASKENPTAYFKEKGYDTILTYNEMIR